MNGSGDVWAAALRAQDDERRQAERDALVQDQRGVDGEMEELMERTRREDARRQLDLGNVMASAIKRSGGGPLPEALRGFINRRYGWDGRTTGVLPGSGFREDGSYLFRLANGADAQGRVATQDMAFGMPQLYQMMQVNRTAFGDGDRAAMRNQLLKAGLTAKEVSAMEFDPFPGAVRRSVDADAAFLERGAVREAFRRGGTPAPDHIRNQMGGGAGGRQIGRTAILKGRDTRPHGGGSISWDGDRGMSVTRWTPDGEMRADYGTRAPDYQGRWRQISVGPSEDGRTQVRRYENDKTGEVVSVRDGETPPWQGGISERERIARMNEDGRNLRTAARISARQNPSVPGQGETLKDKLSALAVIKDFLFDKDGAVKEGIDEVTSRALQAAYASGIDELASQFHKGTGKAERAHANTPTVNKDGTLTLPDGKTLQKDQEYTNPNDGKRYIWRGGDAKNWESLED